MGGHSSSSSSQPQTQGTQSADGVNTGKINNVTAGGAVTINDNLPPEAADIFKQLTDLAGQSINAATSAGQQALDTLSNYNQNLAQPDTAFAKYIPIIIIGFVAVIYFIKGK